MRSLEREPLFAPDPHYMRSVQRGHMKPDQRRHWVTYLLEVGRGRRRRRVLLLLLLLLRGRRVSKDNPLPSLLFTDTTPPPPPLPDPTPQMNHQFDYHPETAYIAVQFFDRYLSRVRITQRRQFQLLAVTSLYLAAKVEEEILEPLCSDMTDKTGNLVAIHDIRVSSNQPCG